MSIDTKWRLAVSGRTMPLRTSRGFTLTELLVGVVIGLIGIVAMFQVLAIWDTTKRTGTAGSDAQIAGTVGFYRMERDIKQGGMGFGAAQSTLMGCNVSAIVNATATTNARGAFSVPMVPVRITQGASNAPDRLDVFYGNSAFFTAEQPFTSSTAFTKKTTSRHGFKIGDAVVVANTAANCALIEVSNDTNADLLTLDHAAGSLRYNPAAGTGATFSAGIMFNLGQSPQLNTWEVANGALVVTDGLQRNVATTVADGVIDLQAQYGLDTNGDYKVDVWQDAAPANWTQLLAVRVAILTRSQQYERTRTDTGADVYVTPVAPILPWTDAANNDIDFAMKNVDGGADSNPKNDNDWRNYRYRVYGGVVPLRNLVWGVSP